MSVSRVLDFENKATVSESVRCYNLWIDGNVYDINGNTGSYLVGTISMTGTYSNDSYTVGITGIAYTKIGNEINLQIKSMSHTVVSSGGTFTLGTLPVALRPITTQRYIVIGVNNGTTAACTLEIGSNGVLTLYNGVSTTTFSAGVGGFPQMTSVTYSAN